MGGELRKPIGQTQSLGAMRISILLIAVYFNHYFVLYLALLDIPWWQKPELSAEKKHEKMKQAEREVKFNLTNRKHFKTFGGQSGQFQSQSWQSGSGQQQQQSFRPSKHPYGRETRQCRRCKIVGHIEVNCRVSADRIKPQSDGYLQRQRYQNPGNQFQDRKGN